MRASRATAAVLVGGAAVALALAGCPSLDAIRTGQDGGDAGPGPADGGRDRSVESGAEDALLDAVGDRAVDTGPACHIGWTPVDAAPSASVESGAEDALLDAVGDRAVDTGPACHIGWTPVDAAPSAACPAGDAGACDPGLARGFSPSWIPPHADRGACSDKQLSSFYAACLVDQQTLCSGWASDPGNLACFTCLYSPYASATYGVLISDGPNSAFNVSGCMALRDPCSEPCARADQATTQCQHAACAPCADAGYGALNACSTSALTCPCAAYEQSFTSCYSALVSAGSLATDCLAHSFVDAVKTYAPRFCGP